MSNLGNNFYPKLIQMANRLEMKPEDIIVIMIGESGLNPGAGKSGAAAGLIQILNNDILHGTGFKGKVDDFRKLSGENQLDYIEKIIKDQIAINGGPFKSAAQYYVGNMLPIALSLPGIKNEDPNTIIVENYPSTFKWSDKSPRYPHYTVQDERNWYNGNKGIDKNKKNNITYGDMISRVNGIKSGSQYKSILSAMRSATGYEQKDDTSLFSNSTLSSIKKMISEYLHKIFASNKQIYKKCLPVNNFSIIVNGNNFTDSIEFSRVLSAALDEELMSKTFIYTDGKNIEISGTIHGPRNMCFNTIKQFSNSFSDIFKTATKQIGGIEIKTNFIMDKKPSYKPINLKIAESRHRKFLLKFI